MCIFNIDINFFYFIHCISIVQLIWQSISQKETNYVAIINIYFLIKHNSFFK